MLFFLYCWAIELSWGQTRNDLRCARDNIDKKCQKSCKLANSSSSWNCCEMTRCKKCWMDVGLSTCGSQVEDMLKQAIQVLDSTFQSQACVESDKFPSFKCLRHFHKIQFSIILLLIVLVAGFIVIFLTGRLRDKFSKCKVIKKKPQIKMEATTSVVCYVNDAIEESDHESDR